jgi:hypothetical protein
VRTFAKGGADGKDKENREDCEWKVTRSNLDILLADAIIAQRNDGLKPKGSFRNYTKASSFGRESY